LQLEAVAQTNLNLDEVAASIISAANVVLFCATVAQMPQVASRDPGYTRQTHQQNIGQVPLGDWGSIESDGSGLTVRQLRTIPWRDIAACPFGPSPLGWPRVQAICDFVHTHMTFGYEHSRPTRTAWEAYTERHGVCRDFAHLAVAFCRCLNIPARYCTGYITDIGLPPPYGPMDFAAWVEVYLGGRWHTFDPRNNAPRIGRILIAHGRDPADVPLRRLGVCDALQVSPNVGHQRYHCAAYGK
jgi:hypothetical protein